MADIAKLLDPKILTTVSGLELLAKKIVEGYLTGANRSLRTGIGQEFSQYRSYQPGDDLRLLDWKMFARSDRYYIREAEVETNINVQFIIDASASMLHKDNGKNKMDYARLMTAALAYLGIKQGDAIGLYAINESKLYHLTPGQGKQHFHRFLYELVKIDNKGRWPGAMVQKAVLKSPGNKELIIFISDMYEHNGEITSTLKHLNTGNNEIILFHLMAENELFFNYKGVYSFEDMETGEKLQVDAEKIRKEYLKNLENHLNKLRKKMLDLSISYELVSMEEQVSSFLSSFLKRRMHLL